MTETEATTETPDANYDVPPDVFAYPDPWERQRALALDGVPVKLAGGATWVLPRAGLQPGLDEARDRIHESVTLAKFARHGDILLAGWQLLSAHYDLSDEETARLLGGAELQPLSDAVLECLFGPADRPKTYSAWARASFLAAGIRPEDVPPEEVATVLGILVRTGRTVPADEYVAASVEAKKQAKYRSMSQNLMARQNATAAPQPPPAAPNGAG